MYPFDTSRKRERLTDDSVFAREISPAMFNLIQGGIVVIGLVINWIFLVLAQDSIKNWNPIILGFFYIAVWFAGVVLMTEVPYTFLVCFAYYMVVAPFGIIVASIIDLSSVKSGTDVVLQVVVIVTCVTSAVTIFSCIMPDRSGNFLAMACVGGMAFAASVTIVALVSIDICIWAWLAALFFCFFFVYDMAHSQEYSRTVKHAVDCAVDTYLDAALFVIGLLIALLGAYFASFPISI
ncbi:MAG: hypothetical protein IKI01_00695 [Lachnospiraceae bacterium]|nr:hypothetical protein [Lachnospiraceae bacterium]